MDAILKLLLKYCILSYAICLVNTGGYSQEDSSIINYFGLTPPGTKPELFNPDFIADSSFVQNCCFSPDGREFYFVVTDGNWSYSNIFWIKNNRGVYKEPEPLFPELSFTLVPFVSYDNDKIFFISSQSDSAISGDIFVAKRQGTTWKNPKIMNGPVNTKYDEWEVCLSRRGTLYFSSNRPGGFGEMDIYKSELIKGSYSVVENLGRPINTYSLDECAYVAPDESYLIFNSWKKSEHKGNNLYISFNRNGKWTNPKSLGDDINTDQLNIYPYVSPDGQYIFFTLRKKPFNCIEPSKFYWLSSSIIDSLRNTNFIPYVNKEIPDTSFPVGKKMSYQIPSGTFIDDDKNDILKYLAALETEEELPNWLEFDPVKMKFTGTPIREEIIHIKIKVFDDKFAEASSTFKVQIINAN